MFPSLKIKEDNRIAIKEIEKIDDKYDVHDQSLHFYVPKASVIVGVDNFDYYVPKMNTIKRA